MINRLTFINESKVLCFLWFKILVINELLLYSYVVNNLKNEKAYSLSVCELLIKLEVVGSNLGHYVRLPNNIHIL